MAIQFPDDESKELEAGQEVPEELKSLCKRNEYGQYSLRFNKFLYIVNDAYIIEEKAPDTLSYDPLERAPQVTSDTSQLPEDKKDMMDSLPEMDEIGINENDNIVDNIIEIFTAELNKYNIETGDLKKTILGKTNRESLRKVYMGDLSFLAEDSQEINGIAIAKSIKETGLSLLKAVLIHEFFSIPKLKEYDDNRVLWFLSQIIALEADGLGNAFIESMSAEQQQEMMFFFKEISHIYKDKTDLIGKIHDEFGTNILKEYAELQKEDKDILFRAFFISKIFHITSKKDRGNKITMILALKEIIDFE
jgi:hypothetical protein